MQATERISALISDYRLANNSQNPKRITVSAEVARELEAEFNAREAKFESSEPPMRLREGQAAHFAGIPLVADLPENQIIDVR